MVHHLRAVIAAALMALGTLVAGCSQTAAPVSGLVNAESMPERDYRLSSGDKIRIIVYGETDLSGDYEVGAAGTVSLPLLGAVPAKGKTIPELSQTLRERLERGYLQNPQISIEVLNYRPFYLHGEVRNGGQFAYTPGLQIADAVAMAGGYTYRADTSYVYLRRNAGPERAVSIMSGLDVLPGDNIRVPERFF